MRFENRQGFEKNCDIDSGDTYLLLVWHFMLRRDKKLVKNWYVKMDFAAN